MKKNFVLILVAVSAISCTKSSKKSPQNPAATPAPQEQALIVTPYSADEQGRPSLTTVDFGLVTEISTKRFTIHNTLSTPLEFGYYGLTAEEGLDVSPRPEDGSPYSVVLDCPKVLPAGSSCEGTVSVDPSLISSDKFNKSIYIGLATDQPYFFGPSIQVQVRAETSGKEDLLENENDAQLNVVIQREVQDKMQIIFIDNPTEGIVKSLQVKLPSDYAKVLDTCSSVLMPETDCIVFTKYIGEGAEADSQLEVSGEDTTGHGFSQFPRFISSAQDPS